MKGAFTGAVYPKKGLFDVADKGSIFFDEIGNIPIETQAKLLRVMQEREFMRLGGMETIRVDVRIIAATNVDLKHEMEEGRFREDLYYRLHVISIELPPLRERRDDIPLLRPALPREVRRGERRKNIEVAPEALDLLMEYDWPGNVRELENVIERAVVLSTGNRIGTDLIPEHVRKNPSFQIPHVVMPADGVSLKEVTRRLRAPVDRVGARGRRRRPEARRGTAAHQADHAQRNDQALRHPPAPEEGVIGRRRRPRGRPAA